MRAGRGILCVTLAMVLCGASAPPAPKELDSQLVVNRYLGALAACVPPKNVAFTYSVSQAGVHNIEQTHRIFRGGSRQRDETIAVDGDPLKSKLIRMVTRNDRYAIAKIAPRTNAYAFLFLGTHKNGRHFDYVYSVAPLGNPAFKVTELTISGADYMPALIRFAMSAGAGGRIHATGTLAYQKIGSHCVPQLATVEATVSGKPTRERILWSAYSFPAALPPSTFFKPKPVAVPTLPPF